MAALLPSVVPSLRKSVAWSSSRSGPTGWVRVPARQCLVLLTDVELFQSGDQAAGSDESKLRFSCLPAPCLEVEGKDLPRVRVFQVTPDRRHRRVELRFGDQQPYHDAWTAVGHDVEVEGCHRRAFDHRRHTPTTMKRTRWRRSVATMRAKSVGRLATT